MSSEANPNQASQPPHSAGQPNACRISPVTVSISAQDASVSSRQLSHSFLFGCNAFQLDPPNPTAEIHFSSLFNFATLGFYWAGYEPRPGEPLHPRTERILEWCRTHRIRCKGHPLTWASIPDPDWLPDDPAEIRRLSLARNHDLLTRFQGRIDFWDVVNEPSLLGWANTRFGSWAQSIGTRPYASTYLRAARAADPGASLIVNEVLTEMPVFSLLNDLRDKATGRLLYDAVGIQSHMHNGPWPLERVQSVCDQFAALGVPLHFSEVTVLSGGGAEGAWERSTPAGEDAQAEYVEQLYTQLFAHPAVQSITWWDFSDIGTWKNAPAGLLRADMSPKPAYERLLHLIKDRWWTRVQGVTDAKGEFRFNAFHGEHEITITLPSGDVLKRTFICRPGRDNRITLNLDGSF